MFHRRIIALLTGGALGTVAAFVAVPPADAATSASYSVSGRTLTVIGDDSANDLTIGAGASGLILVNGGAVPVAGRPPTVGNTDLIEVYGHGGDDRIVLVGKGRAVLPASVLLGGSGDDVLVGGDRADQLLGQSGDDELDAAGGDDLVSGGQGSDTLRGGPGEDQVLGDEGEDRLVWAPGDASDRFEGGGGRDRLDFTGAEFGDSIRASGLGTRLRLERVVPEPFAIDAGGIEDLDLDLAGGDDQFETVGALSGVVSTTIDGGAGRDFIFGSDGDDVIRGGDGDDVVVGGPGRDEVSLGGGDDRFRWRPGDDDDLLDGQSGADRLDFAGSNVSEHIEITRDGDRVRLFRDVATVSLELAGTERIEVAVLGGADQIRLGDLTGTPVTDVETDLAGPTGQQPDGQSDEVQVSGTAGADEIVASPAGVPTVTGLPVRVTMLRADASRTDRLTILGGPGEDLVDATTLPAAIRLAVVGEDGDDVAFGGVGDDILLGNGDDDVLLGGSGNDVLDGGPGTDILDGGLGTDVLLNGEVLLNGRGPDSDQLTPQQRSQLPAAARRVLGAR